MARSRSPETRSRNRSPDRHRSSDRHKSSHRHRHRSRSEDRSERKKRHRDRSASEERSTRHKHKKGKKEKKEKKYKGRYSEGEDEAESEKKRAASAVEALGYSNVNNPFNDVNLESKFVWGKKKQSDKKKLGYSELDLERRERDRKKEAEEELAKLNKRRAEREREIEEREEEQARIQRDAELAQMGDWEAKEEEFHLEQAKTRAAIRIRDGRAKPIDILAMNLRLANEPEKLEEDVDLEIDLDEPYTIFDNLSLADTDELHKDIQMHLALEKNPKTLEFWRAMIVVAEDALSKMKENDKRVQAGGFAHSVNENIHRILSGKTVSQLSVLQKQIMQKLSSNEPVDVEYWENLLKELVVYKAKAKLNDMHQEILATRLQQLRNKQREEALKVQEELERVLSMQETEVYGQGVGAGEGIESEPVDEELTEAQDQLFVKENNTANKPSGSLLLEEYSRAMSPEPMTRLSRDDSELEIVDPAADLKELMEKRRVVLNSTIITRKPRQEAEVVVEKVRVKDESIASSVLFEQEAAKGVDEDEDLFNIEAELATQTYNWQDKYRPRKPRYFNRVHTGYEWNKYNQTHYDLDNPPPKVVQGYKFNIFYPDLIDKSVAPTYYIDKDPDSPDTVLIRFHAGPPYEDIAFRIVNREWEYSHKKGFKCSFDRGVLSLWFHFKRQFYRK
ncbi:mid region of cactin-domain-containing protein [Helicostylum pulchrum]|nr:mid region of cactin-domain-containing protein [Helicostylum pulchrum]